MAEIHQIFDEKSRKALEKNILLSYFEASWIFPTGKKKTTIF